MLDAGRRRQVLEVDFRAGGPVRPVYCGVLGGDAVMAQEVVGDERGAAEDKVRVVWAEGVGC